jgi:hypothetical protein
VEGTTDTDNLPSGSSPDWEPTASGTAAATVQVGDDKDYNEYVLGCYYGELNALRNLFQAAKVHALNEASEFESNKLGIDELQVEIAELEERLVAWGHDPKLSQAASVTVPVQGPVPVAVALL